MFNGLRISFVFTVFISLSLILSTVATTLIVYKQIQKTITKSLHDSAERELKGIEHTLKTFVDIHLANLKDVSAFPILIQSLMQPENNYEVMSDFLDALKIQGNKYDLVLLDYEGEPFYQSIKDTTREYKNSLSYTKLISDERKYYINIIEKQSRYYIQLAVPVDYLDVPEGVFIAQIPIEKIASFLILDEQFKETHFSIEKDRSTIFSLGERLEGIVKKKSYEDLNIDLIYTIDKKYITEAIGAVTFQIIWMSLIIVFMTIFMSFTLGKKYFVAPLLLLRDKVAAFKFSGVIRKEEFPNFKFLEMNQLSLEYEKMADEVIDKAHNLSQVNSNLEKIVEDRTQAIQAEKEKLEQANEKLNVQTTQLERSNEELEKFAFVASHDLKAPLRAIGNISKWVSEDLSDVLDVDQKAANLDRKTKEEIRDNLRQLNKRVKRMGMLLDDLLDYSRVGKKEYDKQTIDVKEFINDIVEFQGITKKFQVKTNLKVAQFKVDKVPFEVVTRNLISNAAKHHDKENGLIEISFIKKDSDFIEVSIQDDGPGIPLQHQQRIFELFQTLQSRDKVEGTGMGLAIVKKTVEHYGGTITVESFEGQRGTKFIFSWKTEASALV